MLADDIIIHGRTLNLIYQRLESWFAEAGIEDYTIDIMAYAESRDGLLDVPALKGRQTELQCTEGQWRNISNEIVDIFYLMGQPYTSYVPNYRVHADTEEGRRIGKFIAENEQSLIRITNPDMEIRHVQSYAYLESDIWDYALSCSVRIYWYQDIQEYLVVPMVTFKPMKQKLLMEYLQVLSYWMNEEFVERCQRLPEDQCEECVRCVIYGASALFGWEFLEKRVCIPLDQVVYDQREEQYNFLYRFWDKKADSHKIQQTLAELDQVYCKQEQLPFSTFRQICMKDAEIRKLYGLLKEIVEKNLEKSGNGMRDWNQAREDQEALRTVIGKFLCENGRLDEEKCKNLESQRSKGIPVYLLINELKEKMGDERCAFAAVLYAIDFGKGSIVVNKLGDCYMSYLHAGEQNYKYYENHYFPFLFGLYRMEQKEIYKGNAAELKAQKEKFLHKYLEYWKGRQLYYLESDIAYMKGISVEEKFGKVLLYDLLDYSQNPHLKYAVKLADRKLDGVTEEEYDPTEKQ